MVMPDFFELKKSIALGRSQFLLNLDFRYEPSTLADGSPFQKKIRGLAGLYGKKAKRKLYIKGKRDFDNYDRVPPDAWVEFRDHWVLDEAAYDAKKTVFIQRERTARGEGGLTASKKTTAQRNGAVQALMEALPAGTTQQALADLLAQYGAPITQEAVSEILRTPQKEVKKRENP